MGEAGMLGEGMRCVAGLKQALKAWEWGDREEKSGSSEENGEAEMWGSDEELEGSECLGNMKEREGDLDTGEKVARKSPGMRIMEHWWKLWHMHELAMLGGGGGEKKVNHLPWQSVQEGALK